MTTTKGGKRADLGGVYFRSAWEANIARYFNLMRIKWEYEPMEFKFEKISRGCTTYKPDFFLPETKTWVEVKGYMDQRSRTKLDRFKRYYPEEAKNLILIDGTEYRRIQRDFKNRIEGWE